MTSLPKHLSQELAIVMTQRILATLLLGFGLAVAQGPALAGISADPTGPTVTVETPAALQQAYLDLSAWTDGGGTVRLAAGFPRLGEIALSGGGDNPVHITSTDPGDPVQVSRIVLEGVDNLRLSHLHVDSTGVVRANFHRDIDITRSSRIEIISTRFTSNGSITYDPDDPNAVLGERLAMIRHTQDITVSGNHISGYEQGLTFRESTDIQVNGNEITAIQGDGIRLIGVENTTISDNYLHDFSATPNEFTHSDFIQMWSRDAELISSNVTIIRNVLDTGNGVAVQGIWLGNPVYSRGDTAHIYNTIIVADNLIYTGAANGIGVTGARDVRIEGNTLLWNQQAVTIKEDGDTSFFPRIRLHEDITDARVTGNITTRILHGPGMEPGDNILLSWDATDPAFAGTHFVNVAEGGDIGPDGWQLRPDSPWVGTGAPAAQPGAEALSYGVDLP